MQQSLYLHPHPCSLSPVDEAGHDTRQNCCSVFTNPHEASYSHLLTIAQMSFVRQAMHRRSVWT